MSILLRSIAAVVLLLGLLAAAGFTRQLRADLPDVRRAEMRVERNPGNMMFETELNVVRVRQVFLVTYAVSSVLFGVVGGLLLWGVGSLHAKLDAIASDR